MAKQGRRDNGEGTIIQRKDSRWAAAVTVNGKRKWLYGKTKGEVAHKLRELQAKVTLGSFVEPNKMKLSEWLDVWFSQYSKPTVRPLTAQMYRTMIENHIKPGLGSVQLQKLKPYMIQNFYNQKLETLSPRSVRILHNILHKSLKQAVKEGLIAGNPTEATTPPREEKPEIRVLSLEEQKRFIQALEGERLGPAFLLALGTGLRRGEILGLRWEDVDFQEGTIHIRRQLLRVKDEQGSRLIFQAPKTKQGERVIPLPAGVVQVLKAHKARQAQEKLLAGSAYEDNGLVFASVEGKPIDPRNFNRKFYQLLEKAGIPRMGVHSLRHTFATRLLELNEHPKVVQELLGHSKISMTLDTYSHVLPEVKKQAVEKLNSLLQIKKIAFSSPEKATTT